MNAREAARWIAGELEMAGIQEAQLEAEVLVRWAGAMERSQFFAGKEVACERLPLVGIGLRRRLSGEPLAYITGEREFYGRMFAVTPSVLIPRPETELLVEFALKECEVADAATVVDIGTGSGCVAVSVACERPVARVVAVDLSRDALAVAQANASRHGAAVHFARGSLAACLGRADIVLANLPYIPTPMIATLQREVRDFEPRVALDGGIDGLCLIREVVADCGARVRPSLLALEVAAGQADDVAALVRAASGGVSVHRDLAGIERVVCGRWR